MTEKIAIVTGGNRGIGFEICRQLAQRGIEVILTARDVSQAEEAAEKLRAEGLSASFFQLDVTDPASVRELINWLDDNKSRLDVLVNNAGIYLDRNVSPLLVDPDLVRQTLETNYFGPLHLCQLAIPLMRRHDYGRIVNISSQMGSLANMSSDGLAYRTSKTALNAMTRVLAASVKQDNITINVVDPGWVRSDMGGPSAARSLAEGADTPVWLATQPDGGPSGLFFRDRELREW